VIVTIAAGRPDPTANSHLSGNSRCKPLRPISSGAVGVEQKSAMSLGGALGAPMTSFQYDWTMLPIGQQLWLKHLLTYEKFPSLQAPESYNLSQVLEQVKSHRAESD
jgi:hypothetical protein